MLSIGIVGVLCNILCLAVLQKQQVGGGTVEAILFGSLLRTTNAKTLFRLRSDP